MNHLSPSPRKLHLGHFKFFRKFTKIFASQGAPPVSTTRWQIYHWYEQHRRQILPHVPLVMLIPVAKLLPVSMILAANLPSVSTTPVVHLRISQQSFGKILNGTYGVLRNMGETDSGKKPKVENLVTLSL